MNKQQALDLLQLTGNPSEQDIQQAYKTKVKQWHPDRAPEGKTEEFTEKFKQIKQAEEFLLKRNNKPKVRFGEIYKPTTINAEIELSVEELVFGSENKQVVIESSKPCDSCMLTGVSQEYLGNNCQFCKGTGEIDFDITNSRRMTFPCNKCHGTGVQIVPCESCKGTGGIVTRENYTFKHIPPGILGVTDIEGKRVVLTTEGNSQENNITINPETGGLHTKIYVSYPELVLGVKKQLNLFGGKKDLMVTVPPGVKNLQQLKIKQQGIPWNNNKHDKNLYVQVEIDETINWTDKQKKLFEEIITTV
jgi:DnaJ-class molecular chaperone